MSNTQEWNTNWSLFTDELERALQSGASNADLAKLFGGHQIQWSGTIEQIDFDDLSTVIDVALPARTIAFADGNSVMLDGLTLAVAESDTTAWEGFRTGDDITFTADFGISQSPFSSIELKTLRSGKSIIMIRVGNALPVSCHTR